MRTLADYFGLMAYLWLMHGGEPDDERPVLLGEYRQARASRRSRPQRRAIKSSARTARKRIVADEAAA